jgi:hypothetical protein
VLIGGGGGNRDGILGGSGGGLIPDGNRGGGSGGGFIPGMVGLFNILPTFLLVSAFHAFGDSLNSCVALGINFFPAGERPKIVINLASPPKKARFSLRLVTRALASFVSCLLSISVSLFVFILKAQSRCPLIREP